MLNLRRDDLINWVDLNKLSDKDGLVNLKNSISIYFNGLSCLNQNQQEWYDCLVSTTIRLLGYGSDRVPIAVAAIIIAIIRANMVAKVNIRSTVETKIE